MRELGNTVSDFRARPIKARDFIGGWADLTDIADEDSVAVDAYGLELDV
jgi:hypothetical protein